MKYHGNHCPEQPKPPVGSVPSPEELDAMSVEELTQAMEDALDSMADENYDDAVITAYLDAMDHKDPIRHLPDPDGEVARFWQRVRGMTHALPPQFAPTPPRRSHLRRVLHTGLAALLATGVLFAALEAAQAAGMDVFGAVARWTRETFHFSVREEGTEAWFADCLDELAAVGVKYDDLPAWIPEGYVVETLRTYELSERTEIYIILRNENSLTLDILISVFDYPSKIDLSTFEKDATVVQTFQINGMDIYLFKNLSEQNAVCQVGNIVYSIQGDLSQNEIQSIFTSIGVG